MSKSLSDHLFVALEMRLFIVEMTRFQRDASEMRLFIVEMTRFQRDVPQPPVAALRVFPALLSFFLRDTRETVRNAG